MSSSDRVWAVLAFVRCSLTPTRRPLDSPRIVPVGCFRGIADPPLADSAVTVEVRHRLPARQSPLCAGRAPAGQRITHGRAGWRDLSGTAASGRRSRQGEGSPPAQCRPLPPGTAPVVCEENGLDRRGCAPHRFTLSSFWPDGDVGSQKPSVSSSMTRARPDERTLRPAASNAFLARLRSSTRPTASAAASRSCVLVPCGGSWTRSSA